MNFFKAKVGDSKQALSFLALFMLNWNFYWTPLKPMIYYLKKIYFRCYTTLVARPVLLKEGLLFNSLPKYSTLREMRRWVNNGIKCPFPTVNKRVNPFFLIIVVLSSTVNCPRVYKLILAIRLTGGRSSSQNLSVIWNEPSY